MVVVAGSLEDLVMSMSTELLGVDASDLAATIHVALERLARAVDADRAYVLKTNVEGRSAGEAFEEWWAPGIEQRNTPIPALPMEAQRFWFRTLRSGEVVHAEDVEALEAVCPEAAEALRNDGVRSILFHPLMAKEQTVGFIGFERRRESRGWDPTTVSRLRHVGELIVGSVERCHADVERAAFTRDLADRNAELERSNRELQQFASIVSHDLTQPLVVVEGFVHELRAIAAEHPTKGEQAETYGGAAERATRRMRGLIDDVLAVAKAGAPVGKPEPVDLGAVVQDVLADLEAATTNAGAVLNVGPLPVVEGNPTQLRQLFQNLLANAVKFRRADRTPEIAVSAAEAGWGWVISVADNGPGIAPDERENVFEMFRRSTSDAPGLGIGLAVCAKVVSNHHGEIWIDGNDAGGCTICVRLPARQPAV